ncbi:MAG: preprotein translocase subunit SecA [Actinobacteria bacterium]|nr:preprotein translocase subunit SecA [Actinomycetota bacterium]
MSVFTKVLRAGEGKKSRRLAELVPLVNELGSEMEAASDEELQHATTVFRERLANGEPLDELMIEAFAVVREAAWRVIGQRHFDVQLMGGMALHFGWIAEMKTGEGKTLVSTLPAYLNGLAGGGVHMVTVNDYLARRDAEWMGKIHTWLGLTVGLVSAGVEDPAARRAAYACDITYGTNTEFGFDYLRDNMARSRDAMVQPSHRYAIVDEVDSILIDEARTPLIISGPADEAAKLYYQFAGVVRTLRRDEDYEVDEEKRTVVPTESGIEKVERQLGVDNLYDQVSTNFVHQLSQALRAKELYHRDKDYIVDGGEVKIVDEFTGRVLEGRRWSEGLHQAVEAKERVRIKEENHTWATITLQNYFRLYEKLAGMTGTAETEASEFASTYNLPVVPIPTHRPMVRQDHPDLVFKTEDAKFAAVVEDLAHRYEIGQPVLVGTASVAKSEHLSRLLDKRGIPHEVLNAKQHAREASIVAQAGRLHAITVATNMAGRGVDILLGGNPDGLALQEAQSEGLDLSTEEGQQALGRLKEKFAEQCRSEGDLVRELGGLYVLGSERHESRRIDNQLRGRSGRQGDPGESRFYLSLEDELMRRFATGAMNWVMDRALPEDVPIEAKMVSKAIERAQTTVEAVNAETRKDVLKYDEVMDKQRKVIYARRLQIIDGEDLSERTEELLENTLSALVAESCPNDYPESWDIGKLLAELSQYYPTQFTEEDLLQATSQAQVTESVVVEALGYYRKRSEEMPGGIETARDIEREVMLQIIDQRWREHLAEMDAVREGINLRAMGQQDPLVSWQTEGFKLFGQLMDIIEDDYLRYVMHVELLAPQAAEPDLSKAQYVAAEDPVQEWSSVLVGASPEIGAGRAGLPPALPQVRSTPQAGPPESSSARRAGPGSPAGGGGRQLAQAGDGPQPGQRAGGTQPGAPGAAGSGKKLGRNDPCWCGSGKKYKLCHGQA